MHHLALWLSVQLAQLFLVGAVAMAVFIVIGAGLAGLYLSSKHGRPHLELISERLGVDFDQVTTLSIRRRMHEALGTGAEIGAAVTGDPRAAQLGTSLRPPKTHRQPPPGLAAQGGQEPKAREASINWKSTMPPASMPLVHALRAADRNTLHPGTFTVIPARCRPPTDESMLPPPPPGSVLKGIPVDQEKQQLASAAPATGSDMYEGVYLTLMGLDAKRQREQLATVTDEPGDAVKASAAAAQEEQASATFEPMPMTLEERIDSAIHMLKALLDKELLKPKVDEEARNLQTYVQYGQVRTGPHLKNYRTIIQIAAHKLRCSASAKELMMISREVKRM
jgi:hypothetical protein